MQQIDGKIIFTEVEEIVDPSHTALVILGVQNNAVDLIFNKNEFMTGLNSVVRAAREKKIPVFFTKIQYHPLKYQSPAWIYTSNKLITRPSSPSEQGLALAIEPTQDEIVMNMRTSAIFIEPPVISLLGGNPQYAKDVSTISIKHPLVQEAIRRGETLRSQAHPSLHLFGQVS